MIVHLTSAPGNALYTSKTMKNQLITICGDLTILIDIQHASFFSVIAKDIANQEQLAISIHFISNSFLCERFIAFHKDIGRALAENILSKLTEGKLQLHLLRGQAYHGAGAMARNTRGVATRIREKHPKADCTAHRLNLCVVKCCSIREVNNMMQTAESVAHFINNSPKRQLALDSANMPTEKRELCRTCWVKRHE